MTPEIRKAPEAGQLRERLTDSTIPEEDKLFSMKRTIRGAKAGAIFGLGVVGIGLVFGGIFDNSNMVELVKENPVAFIKVLGIVTGGHAVWWGAIGGAVDGFRPTSRITTRFINEEISMFKGLFKGN